MLSINNNVLLVEDSVEIQKIVQNGLRGIVELTIANNIEEAKKILTYDKNSSLPGLILLDINLPDGSGINYCQELNSDKKLAEIPLFFLTSDSNISTKLLGFSLGAEDYIVKPFDPLELKARVESKLKKQSLSKKNSGIFEWDSIKINCSTQKAETLIPKKKIVELTALEFKILAFFAKKPEIVIPREEILDEIWGKDVHVYPRSVDTHVSKLRKKLGDDFSYIESIHSVGYKFTP